MSYYLPQPSVDNNNNKKKVGNKKKLRRVHDKKNEEYCFFERKYLDKKSVPTDR